MSDNRIENKNNISLEIDDNTIIFLPSEEKLEKKDVSFLNCEFDTIIFQNTTVENIYSFQDCNIAKLKIKNSDFKELFELHKCTITESIFEEIKFNDLTLFDKSTFENHVEFKYVMFKDYVHFRDCTFKNGLNLEYSSCREDMNFFDAKGLDSKESLQKTSQETYRIIKHNFDKLGNKIEANKYHMLELKKRKENIKCNFQESIVFKIHELSSDYSTNWAKPLLWSLVVAFVTTISLNTSGTEFWNRFWEYCYIGNMSDTLKANPFIFLVNKISLGYLYYQFLTAIRKDTRK